MNASSVKKRSVAGGNPPFPHRHFAATPERMGHPWSVKSKSKQAIRPEFLNTASKGRWAELMLVVRLLAMGLRASLPAADDSPYDVVVENPATGKLQRVQVRATASQDKWGYYYVSCIRSTFGRRRKKIGYTPRDIELFAFYVIPEDAWYIVPVRAVAGVNMVQVRPQRPTRRQRWEKYRERWELMRGRD
jgi:hypothetical protein